MTSPSPNQLTIIGIHDDGLQSLSPKALKLLDEADVIIGSIRQLSLLDLRAKHSTLSKATPLKAQRKAWPSPLKPFLDDFVKAYQPNAAPIPKTCILASGNPMLYGIGATLGRLIPANALTIIPMSSTQALICSAMAWPQQETSLISLCSRPLSQLNKVLFHKTRLIILSNDRHSPLEVARLLCEKGFEDSAITLFENIAGQTEKITPFTARSLSSETTRFSALNAMALHLKASKKSAIFSTVPGLPEQAFVHDSQITKSEVRALTLSALSPRPDNLLWDIGAGSGSIGIEWMRAAPRALAYAIEPRSDRLPNIKKNADALGVSDLKIIEGKAPQALSGLPAPDAIFIGGGLTQQPNLIKTCQSALKAGGRLVINAVTLQSETTLYKAYENHGGQLTQIQISKPDKIGRFDSWHPSRPVTQWCYVKPF